MEERDWFSRLKGFLDSKGGSRILKWGMNFCNNVREIKYYLSKNKTQTAVINILNLHILIMT